MSHQINLTDGVAMLVDGSGTPNEFHITPTVGDVNANNTSEVEVYLHRGKVQTDGAGTRLADEELAEATFTIGIKSDGLADGVNFPTLVEWMRGGTSAAITAAGWTSTTTRTGDEHRTLHFDWYPDGTGAGKTYYRYADALITVAPSAEGRPTSVSVTVKSTTAPRPTVNYVP